MPKTNPVHLCDAVKPELHRTVRLIFDDGRRAAGNWTGRMWWSERQEVIPLGWQYYLPETGATETEALAA